MISDVAAWRQAAVALCEYACATEPKGRSKDDPVYAEVTQGRDTGVNRRYYSSCADLGHWLLWRAGVRAAWVNRDDTASGRTWRRYVNISLLATHAEPMHFDSAPPGPGDICLIWNDTAHTHDAHCCVALSEPRDGKVRTANYGAGGMSAAAWPGAKIVESDWALTRDQRGWRIGTRQLRFVIRAATVAALATAQPDITGALLPGEVIDAIGAA